METAGSQADIHASRSMRHFGLGGDFRCVRHRWPLPGNTILSDPPGQKTGGASQMRSPNASSTRA